MADKQRRNQGGKVLPALCNVFGTLLIIAVIALSLPLALPRVLGYQVYDVITPSMEPAIPTGSVVYVKPVAPSDVKIGDVIAFFDKDGIVVHRVTVNRTSLGEFVTKGDANNVEDFEPVPYTALVGRVEVHLPFWGAFMSVYSSTVGKVYLLLTAACGVMLNILASRLRSARKERELSAALKSARADASRNRASYAGATNPAAAHAQRVQAARANSASSRAVPLAAPALDQLPEIVPSADAPDDAAPVDSAPIADEAAEPSPKAKRSGAGKIALRIVIILLAVVFVGSAGVIGFVTWQYGVSDKLYSEASDKYIASDSAASSSASSPNKVPISVDFNALRADNPDVVGWIYCAGTPIDYPVLQGETNEQYLYHDYTGTYNISGSIFVDSYNKPGFVDAHTIIYGHNMNSGSMFAALQDWADQAFYDAHPVIWLLTPTQNYKIVLFSGHHTAADSNLYTICRTAGNTLDSIVAEAVESSDFVPAPTVHLDPSARYVMLSTCAYLFNNDRYVLHGMLVPVA